MSCACITCGGRLCERCGKRAVAGPRAKICEGCRRDGLKMRAETFSWSVREDRILRLVYSQARVRGILSGLARILGRSKGAISERAERVGMRGGRKSYPMGECEMCEAKTPDPYFGITDSSVEIMCRACWEGLQQLRARAA